MEQVLYQRLEAMQNSNTDHVIVYRKVTATDIIKMSVASTIQAHPPAVGHHGAIGHHVQTVVTMV